MKAKTSSVSRGATQFICEESGALLAEVLWGAGKIVLCTYPAWKMDFPTLEAFSSHHEAVGAAMIFCRKSGYEVEP